MITSGIVPATVMYQLMLTNETSINLNYLQVFPYLGFLIALGSCYRLANFNIDTRQTDSFIGLPTPANSLLILSLPLVLQHTDSLFVIEALTNQWVLLVITLFSTYILNAEIPLFSLKIKKFNFAANKIQIVFLLLAVLLIVFLQFLAIPLVIVSYVLLSIINNRLLKM